jgi:DNA-nicking Smr family endonuclease
MSKDAENPFAQLDRSMFPSSRDGAGKSRRPSRGAVRRQAPAEAAPEDEDAALFLNALGGQVHALGSRGGEGRKPVPDRDGTPRGDAGEAVPGGAQLKEQFNIALSRKAGDAHPHPGPARQAAGSRRPAEDGPLRPALDHGNEDGAAMPPLSECGRGAHPGQDVQDADELPLFMEAVQGATPLHSRGRDVAVEARIDGPAAGVPVPAMQDAMEGPLEFAVCSRDEYAEGHVVGLDLMLLEQLKARQFSPEAHIDLHGLNSEQAYWNLLGFFRGAYFKGLRVAIVVTGRGLNSPSGIPVLKTHVQRWLAQDPLKRVVLAFCSARQEDGGTGAFYVLLRKRKKSAGKICWNIAPPDADFS